MSAPFMPLYVADFMADTTHLDGVATGAYLMLLMAMWKAGGKLPSEDKRLARLCRLSDAQWADVRSDVLEFFKRRGGHIINDRLSKELAKYENKIEQRKLAGKASASKKNNKNNNEAPTNVEIPLQQNPTNLELEPEQEREEEKKHTKKEWAAREDFESCWKSFPHVKTRKSKEESWKQFEKLKPDEQKNLLGCIERFDATLKTRDREYVKGFHLWIRDGYWRAFCEEDRTDETLQSLVSAYAISGVWHPEWGDKPDGLTMENAKEFKPKTADVIPIDAKQKGLFG